MNLVFAVNILDILQRWAHDLVVPSSFLTAFINDELSSRYGSKQQHRPVLRRALVSHQPPSARLCVSWCENLSALIIDLLLLVCRCQMSVHWQSLWCIWSWSSWRRRKWLRVFFFVLFLIMILSSAVSVVLRHVFKSSSLWKDKYDYRRGTRTRLTDRLFLPPQQPSARWPARVEESDGRLTEWLKRWLTVLVTFLKVLFYPWVPASLNVINSFTPVLFLPAGTSKQPKWWCPVSCSGWNSYLLLGFRCTFPTVCDH